MHVKGQATGGGIYLSAYMFDAFFVSISSFLETREKYSECRQRL